MQQQRPADLRFTDRYNVTIGSSSSILGPQIPEGTREAFRQHLGSFSLWSLTGEARCGHCFGPGAGSCWAGPDQAPVPADVCLLLCRAGVRHHTAEVSGSVTGNAGPAPERRAGRAAVQTGGGIPGRTDQSQNRTCFKELSVEMYRSNIDICIGPNIKIISRSRISDNMAGPKDRFIFI